MKKELIISIIIVSVGWIGSFAYSYGVTNNKIENITGNIVSTADFATQTQKVADLVVTVNRLTNSMEKLIDMMLLERIK